MPEKQGYIPLPIYSAEAHFTAEASLGEVEFACDLSVCKGACCTMPGGRGAPILKSEIAELESVFPAVKKYLPSSALQAIEDHGIWQIEIDGSFTITAVERKECIFVTWEDGIAYCA